jgi:DNA repair protein RecN (Recombination protein N)
MAHDNNHSKMIQEYESRYIEYQNRADELVKMLDNEKRLAELIEFTTYEISKIQEVDPKDGEDEELMQIKQQLSKIDKINDALLRANTIFESESSVSEIFRLLGKDESYFVDAMNQLRVDFDETQVLVEELGDIDVEEVLDRLEKISGLKKRYGSIGEALDYLELKQKELASYQTIEQDKSQLESFLAKEFRELTALAQKISKSRASEALLIEKRLAAYLKELKLPMAKFIFEPCDLSKSGGDLVDIHIGGSTTSSLSGGEFNRLRLAFLVITMEQNKKEGGVIILDEIDANVSGDESIAIASMISKLSTVYQIFAISHQAHLSALADQHILVTKESGISLAKTLDEDERIAEISRIIGGEKSDKEAVAFAKVLRGRV